MASCVTKAPDNEIIMMRVNHCVPLNAPWYQQLHHHRQQQQKHRIMASGVHYEMRQSICSLQHAAITWGWWGQFDMVNGDGDCDTT
jgi:hypothetical protein